MEISISNSTLILGTIIIIMSVIIVVLYMTPPECSQTRIIERVRTRNPLDIQFSRDNFPSVVHNEMFVKSTPWIGGYGIGSGKTYIRNQEMEEQPTE